MTKFIDLQGREIVEGFYTYADNNASILLYIENKPTNQWLVNSPNILMPLTQELAQKLKRIYDDEIKGYLDLLEEQVRFGRSTLEKIAQSQPSCTQPTILRKIDEIIPGYSAAED